MSNPTIEDWMALKQLLRYLKHTIIHDINIQPATHPILNVYTNVDWAGCIDDQKSTGGYYIFLGPTLISWSSNKQPTIARWSTEAEYKAIANTYNEVPWITHLLLDIGHPLGFIPTIWCDNLSATYLTISLVQHTRIKHVELNYYIVKNLVARKAIHVNYKHP